MLEKILGCVSDVKSTCERASKTSDSLKYSHPQVSITYFVKDIAKEGGSYETVTGTIKNIDSVFYAVVMDDGMIIPIKDIFAIEL